MLKVKKEGILKDLICLIFLILVSVFFFLSQFPGDLGDVGLSLFSNDSVLFVNHQGAEPFLDFIKEVGSGFAGSYYFHTIAHPLTPMLLHVYSLIFGLSIYNSIILSLFFGFVSIITAYLIGKIIYGRLFGLVLATLMAMDVYFNVNLRTGSIFYVSVVPLILLTIYFFLRAHLRTSGKGKVFYVILSSLFFPLCFIGYPQTIVVLPILILFLMFMAIRRILEKGKILLGSHRFHLLNYKYYILFFISVIVFYLSYSLAWESYNKVPFFTIAKQTVLADKGRYFSSAGISPLKMGKTEFKLRVSKFSDTLFLDMDRDAYFSMGGIHSDTAFPGQPIIPYVSGVFFFLGLYYLFKKRRESDLLLLIFLGITVFIIIFVFKPYAPRVYIFSTPFLLMVAALGYLETFSFILNKIFKAKYQFKALLIISLVLVLNFSNYDKITKDFEINRAGQKIWSAGQTRIYDYLQKEKVNERSLVVLSGTKDVYAWLHFINIRGRMIPTIFYIEEDLNQKDFALWEKDKFSKFDTIYFVFPSAYYVIRNPGRTFGNYGMKRSFKPFLNAHPTIRPAKIIYAKSNIPLHYIYKINKNDQYRKRTKGFMVSQDKPVDIRVDKNSIVEALYVNGPLQSIIFDNGDGEQRIPLNLTKNMDCYIDFGRDSTMEFYPDFNGDEPFENVVAYDNIRKGKGRKSKWQEGKGGFRLEVSPGQRTGTLTYKLDSPFEIIRADVRTSPRMFNDYLRLNRVEAFYSVDDKNYRELYRVVSNGNVRYSRESRGDRDRRPDWAGFEAYATYNVVYPNSPKVYFKFILTNVTNSDAQLLSANKTMFFKALIDTSSLKRPIIKDNTKMRIESNSKRAVKVYLTFKP